MSDAVAVALAKVSLLDEVVRVARNSDDSVIVYVRGPVSDSYDRIVDALRRYAPAVTGEVRRAQASDGRPSPGTQ